MKKIAVFIIISFGITQFSALGQTLKPFVKGDRVAFVGNSITEAGYYETYIWLYYMTHFPEMRIEVRNVGIGGDVSRQINERLDGDAFAVMPTVLALTFGMNDSGYFEYNGDNPQAYADERVAESYLNFQSIIEKLNSKSSIRKIMMSSSPYDETMKNKENYFPGKSKTMERMVDFQKKEAEQNKWEYVDFYYPMQAINLEGQKTSPEFTITGPDRIHPGNGGHMVMAYLFLKAQGLASPVAEVSIDAKNSSIQKNVNAVVSNISSAGGNLSFDYLAKSLPYPVDTVSKMWGNDQKQTLALEVTPFMEEFDREMLQVENLDSDKKYTLKIDGETIGIWNGAEFQKGINLAEMRNTPQYKQAWTVMNLANTLRNIDNKLREYYWMQFDFFKDKGMLFQDDQKAIEVARVASEKDFFTKSKMEAYEALRFEDIRESYEKQFEIVSDVVYRVNKPIERKFEIVLVD